MMALRALFRCWFYDFSCHRSKAVAKFGEASHRISQVGMIVALLNGWKLFSVGSVAQPFLDEDGCRCEMSYYYNGCTTVAQNFLDMDDCRVMRVVLSLLFFHSRTAILR